MRIEQVRAAGAIQGKEAKMRVSTNHLQQLAIFTTVLTGGETGTMYYLMQKKFAGSDYYTLALQKLEECPEAMESLGVPPLKVYNIHLTDRHNRVDHNTAQVESEAGGAKAPRRTDNQPADSSSSNCCTGTEHTQELDT
ncbi:cytochrome c oxidase assembly factor 1 homolog isoform X2 [Lates calcarifer]|uniref:Cytochrome c oxidase assembly factor 1 homolog isoform X2 n=1 Tax=Lates calcarifer TaxID=8187 RepID=A0AAJ8DP16_LATCA|nr:cytochrome c oxidase assembly factor 1 homolog isoform X2 [Lates calcarifer]